ncbi:DgyrCDS12370 [Dimorphilus gyrociliatus]|uniref:DgyrCDS12370 n=1 Tax=Dimorphilus gyrociliatus TaxID=2664684 RepID=A0A7I8W785_9ANNE|nr:DgyrCDS12370 [Dimorphilus gyrociliatus]
MYRRDNNSNLVEKEDNSDDMPVYGLPGYRFYVFHYVGLICLVTSLFFTTAIFVLIFKNVKTIFKSQIGERLIFYMAVFDFGYCTVHLADHIYMLIVKNHPPDMFCAAIGFLLNEFVVGQCLVVIFTAVNAFYMVVKEKRIKLGKYDWRLHIVAFGLPLIICCAIASIRHWGRSGAWCFLDNRRPYSKILQTVIAVFFVLIFVLISILYSLSWIKIKKISRNLNKILTSSQEKYHKTAKIMMLFVISFIAQWWSFMIYAAYGMYRTQPFLIVLLSVIFSNLGGIFNFITNAFVKRNNVKISSSVSKSN